MKALVKSVEDALDQPILSIDVGMDESEEIHRCPTVISRIQLLIMPMVLYGAVLDTLWIEDAMSELGSSVRPSDINL